MRRASTLQLPHLVFIFLMPQSATWTPRTGCHFSTAAGSRLSIARDTSAAGPARAAWHWFRAARAGPEWRCSAESTLAGPLVLDDAEAVTPPEEVVALAADHLAFGLARLGLEPARWRLIQPSLPITASRTRHRSPQGRGHPHPAVRRIDAEVQVLDVLADDLDGQPADVDLVLLSTHSGSSPAPGPGRPGVVIPEHGLDRELHLLDLERIAAPVVLPARPHRVIDGEGQCLVPAEVVVERPLRRGVERLG